ncbi:hypothetical protein MMC13_004176 [Lambiella insularis]|nr:hypothetical protein [Lambiella insularis]
MASLLFAAGILTYDKVKTTREKRRARKEDTALSFSELEKENAERMARLHPDSYQPPAELYARSQASDAADRTRRISANPLRDSTEEVRERSSTEMDRRLSEDAGDRPPEYEALVREDRGKTKSFKGAFGRKGKRVGDGVVR